jgi:hypothetical protein
MTQSSGRFRIPPPQQNLKRAIEAAFETFAGQSPGQLAWLGAEPAAHAWRLAVLSDAFLVDASAKRITTAGGADVGPAWTIVALHYLSIRGRPQNQAPEVTFADLPTARSYASVYHQRVVARLCATAGRDAKRLHAAAVGLGGRPTSGGDAAFDFDVFPRFSVRLIWHAPDEEFPPAATLLLPANAESCFCSEDIVVLSESLVARLSGRPF